MAATEPLIVNVALTGMVPTKALTPHVPITVDEILEDVARCRELGAAIVHVHAREDDGTPSSDPAVFAPIIEGIRAIDPELVVCASCSGRGGRGVDARAAVLSLTGDARPDMASLTLGSLNFPREASVNAPDVIRELARRMQAAGIVPELEAFEPGMLAFAERLCQEGLVPDRPYVNILLGNLGTAPASVAMLAAFLAVMPARATWALGGIGRFQLDTAMLAVAAGGGVRIGIEDNLHLDRARTQLATNAQLVERVVRMAEIAERPLATPRQVRDRLALARPQVLR
jgi:3-keto-5-aminohexanoate cleavage enzyme